MSIPQPSVGLAAVMASILIPMAQVVAPVVQEIWTEDSKLRVERAIADAKHDEQVADLLLKAYIDQDASDQAGALAIIKALFPRHAVRLTEAFDRFAANDTIRTKAENAVATIEGVGAGRLEVAREGERAGFEALASGDAAAAKMHFQKAYQAYPTYHNVEEIARKLEQVDPKDPRALKRAVSSILKENAWRMPADIKHELQREYAFPAY